MKDNTAIERKVTTFEPVKKETQLIVDQSFAPMSVSASRWLFSTLAPKSWLSFGLPFLCVTRNDQMPQVTGKRYSDAERNLEPGEQVRSCAILYCSWHPKRRVSFATSAALKVSYTIISLVTLAAVDVACRTSG